MKKNILFRKLLKSCCILLAIYIFSTFNNVFSYQIKYIARTKADLNNNTFPELVYRKHVQSFDPTPTNGWIYRSGGFSDAFSGINNEAHNNTTSFERYYEYFHPYQNSNYNLDNSDGGKLMTRYFATYDIDIDDTPFADLYVDLDMPYSTIYNVWGETGNYQGIYDSPVTSTSVPSLRADFTANNNIVIMDNNWFRYGVKDGVWISDNGLSKDTVRKLWQKYGETNVNESGDSLNIYTSSVLRTSSANGLYYQNMDTAYKTWQTLLYGKKKSLWHESPSTTGLDWPTKSGYRALNSVRSVINYFDNILEVPLTGETNIYVRHIDVTNGSTISTSVINSSPRITNIQNPMAISVVNNDWNYTEGWVNQDTTMPWREYYLETYKKRATESQTPWRLANIKYDHETAGSYWQNCLSDEQRQTFSNYNCIGAIVGKADTMANAEANRDAIINSDGRALINNSVSVPYSFEREVGTGVGALTKNGDWTSVVVNQTEKYQYVVIDFYYEREQETKNKVYVRHIDITNQEPINATKANKANRFSGKGIAQVEDNRGRKSNRSATTPVNGYEEVYEISSLEKITIDSVTLEGYSCVGSNMTHDQNGIGYAKSKLDTRLNSSNKYDNITNSRTANGSNGTTVIDFYYKSEYGGTVIEREEVGNLAFYTPNPGSDIFSDQVNFRKNDYIPSNNELRLSVDNAYTFMLGAISIQEQKIEETTTFTYTIVQPYRIKFKYYYSYCSSCSKRVNYDVGEDKGHKSHSCKKSCPEDCDKEYDCYYSVKTDTYNELYTVSIPYTYTVPHEYTFYKVKNMRLYTISKLELLDGYSNWGLPLFDGKTHIVNPVSSYTNTFTKSDNFKTSSDSETVVLTSGTEVKLTEATETSASTLIYDYTSDGIYDSLSDGQDAYEDDVEDTVENLYDDNVSAHTAAKFEQISKTGAVTASSKSIKLKLRVNNDKYYFKDPLQNNTETIIVGDASKSTGTPSNTSAESSYIHSYTSNEYEAVKQVDLYKYTGTSNNTTKILVSTKYPNDVVNKYEPENDVDKGLKTEYTYFNVTPTGENKNLTIPKSRVNGKRYSYGTILYELLGYGVLSFDTSSAPTNTHTFTKKTTIGDTFIDTEMNKKNATSEEDQKTLITSASLRPIKWTYGENNQNSTDIDVVNVFTPVAFSTSVLRESTNQIINHSDKTLSNQIQKNAQFSINVQTTAHSAYGDLSNTNEYVGSYYIKFDFDVQNIKIVDALAKETYPVGSQVRNYFPSYIEAGTWIGPIYNEYNDVNYGSVTIKGYAKADPYETLSVVNQETNSYWIRGVANNATASIKSALKTGRISSTFIDKTDGSSSENDLINAGTTARHYPTYYTQKNIISDSNFVAEAVEQTENISRVYDFKVTDIKDVDWKSIFRKSTSTQTNIHSSNAYYSGIYKWNIYTTANNDIIARSASEIGSTKKQTLPVGPHKHTTTTYVNAPKLGYRFSFDLKTTGENENKKVIIEPEFYYISKDGNTYIDSEHIKLFYRNSDNKYVDISKYDIYFVPDDGYRLTFEGTDAAYRFHESGSVLSKSTLKLGNTNRITLTSKMKEDSDNGFVQIWYGEYKLPNSTIAVKLDNHNHYDINTDRLTNGYIGVKFNIRVEEYSGSNLKRTIYYGQDNTNVSSGGGTATNTSQWDYEGYIGYTYKNSNITSLRIPLENGSFTMADGKYTKISGGYWSAVDLYNSIKGTVILYDIDARASDDYN